MKASRSRKRTSHFRSMLSTRRNEPDDASEGPAAPASGRDNLSNIPVAITNQWQRSIIQVGDQKRAFSLEVHPAGVGLDLDHGLCATCVMTTPSGQE
jgi:hypothetical protein